MARPLHRTAPALDRPARQGLQADEAGRRLLARRSAEPAAPAHLRHLLAQREGAEGLSPPSRGGREARPSAARPRAGPVPSPGGGGRIGVLAPPGLDALQAPLNPNTPAGPGR